MNDILLWSPTHGCTSVNLVSFVMAFQPSSDLWYLKENVEKISNAAVISKATGVEAFKYFFSNVCFSWYFPLLMMIQKGSRN